MQRKFSLVMTIAFSISLILGLFGLLSSTALAVDATQAWEAASLSMAREKVNLRPSLATSPSVDAGALQVSTEVLRDPGTQEPLEEQEFLTVGELLPGELEARQERLDRVWASQDYAVSVHPESDQETTRPPVVSKRVPYIPSELLQTDERTTPEQPSLTASAFTMTLGTVHRNMSNVGQSSTFVFTNTGVSSSNIYLDFYWPNGEFLGSDGPINLDSGGAHNYDMASMPFGGNVFVGWVEIQGDYSVIAQIQTPDYGIISGRVYEDDGTTIFTSGGIDIHKWDDNDWAGGVTLLSDGRYYHGGLPDGDYLANANPDMPWAKQWYNDSDTSQGAAALMISGANTASSINFILRPGGAITGTVYADDGGAPLENVNVDLGQGWFGTWTNGDGQYTISNIPYGEHIVVAGGDWNWCLEQDSIYIREYHSETDQYDDANPVAVNEGITLVTGVDFTLAEGGVIKGQVTAADGGQPLADVYVEVEEYYDRNFSNGSHTDPNGYYTITGLLDNDYVVGVWNPEQTPLGYGGEFYNNTLSYDDADLVTIAGGNTVDQIDFALEAGGWITGVVTEQGSGLPLENIMVEAHGAIGLGVCTNDQGEYQIQGIPFTDYEISASRGWNWCTEQPNEYAQEWYEEVPLSSEAATLAFDGGNQHYSDINFTLERGGTISGEVLNGDGSEPLEGMYVELLLPEGIFLVEFSDQNGLFSFEPVPYGIGFYVLAWSGPYGGPYLLEFWDEATSFSDATPITLTAENSEVSNITLTLDHGGYITGTVRDTSQGDAPVADLTVVAQLPGDCPGCSDWIAETQTAADGSYTLGPLSPEEYMVYACTDCSDILLVNQYYNGAYDTWDADRIAVSTGAVITGIDIGLTPGILLTGHVSVPGGYSAENININVWKWDGINFNANRRTDTNGGYAVPVPPIYDSLWAVGIDNWETDLGNQWAHGFDLDLHTQWDFDLKPGGVITGSVTVDGSPVSGVQVNAESSWQNLGAETDAQGYYQITNLPPAEYRVGAGENWQGYMWTYFGGFDWEWATPIDLGEAATVADINFDISQLGQIEGYVYEEDGGAPIEGLRVTAINSDGYWHAWSQVDGYFNLDVPAGDHRLLFRMEDNLDYTPSYYPGESKWSEALTVTVSSADPLYVTMNMEKKASLGGQVTDSSTGEPLPGVLVTTFGVDPLRDLETGRSTCTDENGSYHIEPLSWGETQVMAVGTCGNHDYGLVTTTLTVLPDTHHNLDLAIDAGTGLDNRFTIRVNSTSDFTPLTSGSWTDETSQVLPALFAPLVQMNDQGEWYSELLVQVPTLQNGDAEIIGDQLQVTYLLKTGLLWSDGAPLTSADIRFAWEMRTQPDPKGNPGISDAKQIETILTPDAQTAVVIFKAGQFPPNYLDTLTYPLPEHILAGEHRTDVVHLSHYAHNPVGNGPYVVENWVPGSHLDLRPNPNYHKRSEGFPVMENIRFLFADDPFWSLVNGQAQASLSIDYETLPPDVSTWGLQYYPGSNASYDNIYLNPETPFFADPLVRQAMYQALDRETFVTSRGHERLVAETWLPPDHALYTDTFNTHPFDLAAAADILTAAGWIDTNENGTRDKDGVEFEFDIAFHENHDARLALVAMFQQDLEAIGVTANLLSMSPWEVYDQGRRGVWDAFTLGWLQNNRIDPGGFDYFHSSNIPTAYNTYERYNFSRWDNPANDTLVTSMRHELDLDALQELSAQQLALYNDELPILTHSHWARHNAADPTLLNFKPQGMTPATWNIETWELPDNPYDLSVRKALALDSPAPQPGATITYEISVRNAGFFTVTGVTLVDDLLPGLIYAGAAPLPGSVNGTILTWDLGTIPPNSPSQLVELAVEIPGNFIHGTMITNTVEVQGDQTDSHPQNNGFVHLLEVRDDIDLAVTKSGVGQPAIGERFHYYLNYANWGGAPASNVVITDTLPPAVSLVNTDPPYFSEAEGTITWTLPSLAGNQWGGQIEIVADIISSGTVTNTAWIATTVPVPDADVDNNQDDHVIEVDEILAPVILRPTQGTTDLTPTVSGLAPSNSTVEIYDTTDPGAPIPLATTTAGASGTFSVELTLSPFEQIILRAKASKDGLTSDWSNTATIRVVDNLPLDPDYITISADDVDISAGSVRAQKYTLANRRLAIQARIACTSPANIHLEVTENALFHYNIPTTILVDLGGEQWDAGFSFWMADPHSNYDIWIEWDCEGSTYRENLMFILIDPDGYLYDRSLVAAGSTITDSIIVNGVVTAYIRMGDEWVVWPAGVYGQDNPQTTDGSTDDGVIVAGYYSFLTPPGQYYLEASAPGYQPYQSEILTVIDTPIHHDIGLQPITGGTGFNLAPLDLSTSEKTVSAESAWVGNVLTFTIALHNTGDEDTGLLNLSDAIPPHTTYVGLSLNSSGGEAGYSGVTDTITWSGFITGNTSVDISFQVTVDSTPGTPYDVVNTAEVTSEDTNLGTLPDLAASTSILNEVGVALVADSGLNGDPGEVVIHQHTLTNTGNAPDTFGFEILSSQGWAAPAPEDVTLDPGESTPVQVAVTIPVGTPAGAEDSTILTATSQTSTAFTASVTDLTTVDQLITFTLSTAEPQTTLPGMVVTYTHIITNDGNATDTFTLTVSSDQAWSVSSDPFTLTLTAGGAMWVDVLVNVPYEAPHGVVDQTTLTVESETDSSVSDSVTDVTTVADNRLYLPLVIR